MIISTHIPKTAGMAFREVLKKIFGKNIFFDYGTQFEFTDPYRKGPKEHIYTFKKNTKMILRGHSKLRLEDRCIHGHFSADKYDQIFPNSKKIIWVRDPLERIASQYHYWHRHPDKASYICNYLLKNKLSLVDFANLDAIKNYQTKFLGKSSIESFAFIGVQEHFNLSLSLMLDSLDLDINIDNLSLDINSNPKKATNDKYNIPNEVASKIQEMNQADYELYNTAVKNLDTLTNNK